MFLFVSFSFSQKKELRTAKKLFSNAQYEEVEKVLLDNQNLFSESDSKLIGKSLHCIYNNVTYLNET